MNLFLTQLSVMLPGPRLMMFCLGTALAAAGCASNEPAAAGERVPMERVADGGTLIADAPSDSAVVVGDSPGPAPDATAEAAVSLSVDGGAAALCQADNDCQLVSDCCSCQAILRGEKAPSCDPNRSCVMSVCAQYKGVDRGRCSAGRCVLGFDCVGPALCKRLPPVCPLGQVPQVVDGCYGECVDAQQCATVASCALCRSGDLCVRTVAAPAGWHCQSPASNLGGM
jgi:hypothetical protein